MLGVPDLLTSKSSVSVVVPMPTLPEVSITNKGVANPVPLSIANASELPPLMPTVQDAASFLKTAPALESAPADSVIVQALPLAV